MQFPLLRICGYVGYAYGCVPGYATIYRTDHTRFWTYARAHAHLYRCGSAGCSTVGLLRFYVYGSRHCCTVLRSAHFTRLLRFILPRLRALLFTVARTPVTCTARLLLHAWFGCVLVAVACRWVVTVLPPGYGYAAHLVAFCRTPFVRYTRILYTVYAVCRAVYAVAGLPVAAGYSYHVYTFTHTGWFARCTTHTPRLPHTLLRFLRCCWFFTYWFWLLVGSTVRCSSPTVLPAVHYIAYTVRSPVRVTHYTTCIRTTFTFTGSAVHDRYAVYAFAATVRYRTPGLPRAFTVYHACGSVGYAVPGFPRLPHHHTDYVYAVHYHCRWLLPRLPHTIPYTVTPHCPLYTTVHLVVRGLLFVITAALHYRFGYYGSTCLRSALPRLPHLVRCVYYTPTFIRSATCGCCCHAHTFGSSPVLPVLGLRLHTATVARFSTRFTVGCTLFAVATLVTQFTHVVPFYCGYTAVGLRLLVHIRFLRFTIHLDSTQFAHTTCGCGYGYAVTVLVTHVPFTYTAPLHGYLTTTFYYLFYVVTRHTRVTRCTRFCHGYRHRTRVGLHYTRITVTALPFFPVLLVVYLYLVYLVAITTTTVTVHLFVGSFASRLVAVYTPHRRVGFCCR